ncbi:hypothetical protein [Spirosoma pulveris]
MLDLAKPLGIHEGLIFYGDHELTDLVYYFPDEVSLAPQRTPVGGASDFYELFFQMFSEGDIVDGSLDDLRKTAGSILSLGVQCTVSPERLAKAVAKLKGSGLFPNLLRATVPPWKDGTVNLMALDAITGRNELMGQDAFVKSILGSLKPSLMSNDLKSIFNLRLDRRGTALILGALEGDTGNVAGVLYDLKYTAIRPALDLRIWANLGRCYDSVSHQLGIKAEFTYGVKFSLGAELNWLTKKMEEDGDLRIEVLSQAEDPETKKMMDEMVKDFKESILREMFRPYVNPESVNLPTLTSLVPVVGVSYKFTKERITHDKVIEADYRERSAVVRTHNPQSHLWVLGKQIAANRDKYVQRVVFSDVWREQSLSIELVHDFTKPEADLLSAEVVIWRAKEGFRADAPPGRFAVPENADPLKSLTFHKDSNRRISIAWLYDKGEPVGYFYQIRFLYRGQTGSISSPTEILTAPQFSTAENLVIFPDTFTFIKRIEVREGNINLAEFRGVDVTLRLKDPADTVLDTEVVTLNTSLKNAAWTVRGKDKTALFIEATREYHFADERPSVKTEPVYLQDDELIVNKPFQRSQFSLIPVVAGHNEAVKEILLEIRVESPDLEEPVKNLFRLKAPGFDSPDLGIKLQSAQDKLFFKAGAITTDGTVIDIDEGPILTNALVIDLNRTNNNEVRFVWRGRSPEALGLKSLRVELRSVGVVPEELEPIEFRGNLVPQSVVRIFPKTQKVEWRVFKRFADGTKEKSDFNAILAREVVIKAE